MLTPSQYDQLADSLAELYAQLEESILQDMVRRMLKMGYLSDATEWQARMLQEAGMLYDDILAEIAQRTGSTQEQLRTVFQNAGIQAIRNDNYYYQQANVFTHRSMSDSALQVLNAGYVKCSGNLKNLTLTTANTSQQAFIQACNLAYMQVSSGMMDYNTAIRKAVQNAAKDGAYVFYPPKQAGGKGHRDKLDVAVRRAVLTGVGQTVRQVSFQNAKDLETDLMELTAHAGARPSHAEWQGQIVSLSGKKGYLTLNEIGYGSVDGFGGVNCRHDWHPYFEGLPRTYSPERLQELNEPHIQIGEKLYTDYEVSQMQRALERKIREKKRQVIASQASGDTEEFQKKSAQLKQAEQNLKDFLKQTGFLNDSARLWVNGFGRSQAQKAVWANRKYQQSKISTAPKSSGTPQNPLTNQAVSGTIKSGNTSNNNWKAVWKATKPLHKLTDTLDVHGATVPENMDIVAKTFEYLTEKYKIKKLQCIKTVFDLSPIANSNHHSLNIRTSYLNGIYNDDALKQCISAYYEKIAEYEKEIASTDNERYKKNLKTLIALCKRKLKHTRYAVGDGGTYKEHLKATIIHEYGHILIDQKIGQISGESATINYNVPEAVALRQKIEDAFEKSKENGDIYKLSLYANKNEQEFFAEAFCAKELGEELPEYISSMIDEVISYGTV